MPATEMDVFAAARGADEVALPQFKGMAAVFTAAGQRRDGEGQRSALGFRAFGEKFKTGFKRPRLHTGNEAHFADEFLNPDNTLPRMRGIMLTN